MNLERIGARLLIDPPGVIETPAQADPYVLIHVGSPVEIGCERGGRSHIGLSVHGDVDIIPAGVESRWNLKKQDCALVVRISQGLLTEVAMDLGVEPAGAVLMNRFQIRDAKIEYLGWALKTEMDHGFGVGRLYADGIGVAMACQLVRAHSVAAGKVAITSSAAMSGFRLRRVLGYIEEHLCDDLSLGAIATASGLSVSHCQRAFRGAVGVSVHQYVLRRRVERARSLLIDTRRSIGDIALAVGFSHQSHLAYHLRRLLGSSPMSLRKTGE
jgi:AraC family transcriptional regulator